MDKLILIIIVWIVIYNIIKKGGKIDNSNSFSNSNKTSKQNNSTLEKMLKEELEYNLKKEYTAILNTEISKIKKDYETKLNRYKKEHRMKRDIFEESKNRSVNINKDIEKVNHLLQTKNSELTIDEKNTFLKLINILDEKYGISSEFINHNEDNLEIIKNNIFETIEQNNEQFFNMGITNKDSNIENSLEYLNLSAFNKDKDAYYNLAIIYKNSVDGIQDSLKSAYYMKMAADLGHPAAANEYAIMLATEDGVLQNIDEAKQYFNIAIENGNTEAEKNLISLNNFLSLDK